MSNTINDFLTDEEKAMIRALNFVATFDGIIKDEDDIQYILKEAIQKFIPKKRQHLVCVSKDHYPVHIIIKKKVQP